MKVLLQKLEEQLSFFLIIYKYETQLFFKFQPWKLSGWMLPYFLQGCKQTHVSKTRILDPDWIGEWSACYIKALLQYILLQLFPLDKRNNGIRISTYTHSALNTIFPPRRALPLCAKIGLEYKLRHNNIYCWHCLITLIFEDWF